MPGPLLLPSDYAPIASAAARAEELRSDALVTLGAGLFGVLVMGLHASGRHQQAYAFGMVGAGIAAVSGAVKLYGASEELAEQARQGAANLGRFHLRTR